MLKKSKNIQKIRQLIIINEENFSEEFLCQKLNNYIIVKSNNYKKFLKYIELDFFEIIPVFFDSRKIGIKNNENNLLKAEAIIDAIIIINLKKLLITVLKKTIYDKQKTH